MKTIITIQHTQSIHHTNGMVGSWTDWDLTELGKEQADRIGRSLARQFGDASFALYSSDLLRARHTAELVGRHFGLTPTPVPELRERNLGKCVGKSVRWLQENLECQEKTVDDRLFSDAESRRDEWNRLKPFFDSLLENEQEHILVVSHGDLLGVFHAMWLGLDVEALNHCELAGMSGGVSILRMGSDGKRRILCMGDRSFLTP